MNQSEIARFREQQQLEESSSLRPAAVARHDAILVHMQQGEATLVELFQQGRDEEAYRDQGILEGKHG